jgi:transcriptional regulator with XRE-family HTH domain
MLKTRRINADLLPFEVSSTASELGEHLRLLRVARRWTQADVASKADMALRTLVKIEAGDTSVQFGHVLKVLWALNSLNLLRDSIRAETDTFFVEEAKEALPKRIDRK